MADKINLSLLEIDLSEIRKSHGLEPMTEKTKKDFCENLLKKHCQKNPTLTVLYEHYSEKMIDLHFQELCEKYIKLKETGDYSVADISHILEEMVTPARVTEKLISSEEKQKFSLDSISSPKELESKLVFIISEGIQNEHASTNANKILKYNYIKALIPDFDSFRDNYLY